MFKSLLKAATVFVDAPVAVARDVITLGGALGDEPEGATHTTDALGRFAENIKDAAEPDHE